MTEGEVVVTTSVSLFVRQIKWLRDKGMNRSRFVRALIDDYIISEGGSDAKLEALQIELLDLEDAITKIKTEIRRLESVKKEEEREEVKKMDDLKTKFGVTQENGSR